MPDDSNGNHSLPPGYRAVDGETILSSQHNPPLEDLSGALSERLSRTGRGGMLSNLDMGGFRTTNQAAGANANDGVTKSQLEAAIALAVSGVGVPSGVIAYSAGTAIPAGWLLCNGAAISRTIYASLFAAIGTTYGVGDGATTFNLPAVGGYFARFASNGSTIDAGRAIGSTQTDLFKSHAHGGLTAGQLYADSIGTGQTISLSVPTGLTFAQTFITGITNQSVFQAGHPIAAEGGSETRPVNIAFSGIIKT